MLISRWLRIDVHFNFAVGINILLFDDPALQWGLDESQFDWILARKHAEYMSGRGNSSSCTMLKASYVASSHSLSSASVPSLFFRRLQSCRLTLSTLFSFFLFVSFVSSIFSLFVFIWPLSLSLSLSLSHSYSTIRPLVDIKLHKQRDAPEGLFALQQIFSDCS